MKTMLHTIRRSSKVFHLSRITSDHTKNPFEFVVETADLAKQNEPSFAKRYKPLSTHYSWYVPILWFRSDFVVVPLRFRHVFSPISLKLFQKNFLKFLRNINDISFKLLQFFSIMSMTSISNYFNFFQ